MKKIIVSCLFAAVLMSAFTGGALAQQKKKIDDDDQQGRSAWSPGTWDATIKGGGVNIRFYGNHWSSECHLDTAGLATLPTRGTGEFNLTREAGKITFKGVFQGHWGHGTYKFEEDTAFKSYLEQKGYSVDDELMMSVFKTDINKGYFDFLKENGYAQISNEQFKGLVRQGMSREVLAAYFNAFKTEGDGHQPLDDLIGMWEHGVTPGNIKGNHGRRYQSFSPDKDKYLQTLEGLNQQISEAYLRHDAEGLSHLYSDDAVAMPEYHPTLFGKKAIRDYFSQWLDSAKMEYYLRKTYDITIAGDYLVETGLFSKHYLLNGKTVSHAGKYLAVWRIKGSGAWQLISEIYGADRLLNRSEVPLSALHLRDTTILPKPVVGRIRDKIKLLNDSVARLVVQRRGKDFVGYYWDDAMYMPYNWPILNGKRAIDAYYRAYADPGTGIDRAYISATRIIESAEYVLVDGYYKIDWNGDRKRNHGTVVGKSITVWKRSADGRLLIFRQMSVND
jgi:ketosteroid isomerase-like protein